ncbi:MAG: hypothetical protein A2Y58_02385 [Chloroflexi bacterium RBG_13_51_52]|nr:MAG: hypothetical protein A2Y58_02385 [Chloroflexi bacterium RBG_13_51_52]
MKKIWLVVIGLVMVIGVVALAGCSAEGTPLNGGTIKVDLNSQQNGIWVSGEGKVTAVPDVAIINLGIEAQETDVATAQAEASEAMDKVTQALKDQGIAEEDIQTVYFNISQVTRWDNDKQTEIVTGYRVTNTVSVKVREVEKAGEVIDAVVTVGGNMIRVSGISFTVDDPSPYYEQARKLAITYAKKKADQMAAETGIELGKITYITESSYTSSSLYRNYAMEDVAIPAPIITTPVSVGQLDITTTVQIAYAIAD